MKWAFLVDGMPFQGDILESDKSLGGSETAGLCLSRELAAQANEVFMFCRCEKEGMYDGVAYQRSDRFMDWATNVHHDVTVIQRLPHVFASTFDSKLNILWSHDLALKRMAPAVRGVMWNLDRIAVLSNFMKHQYQDVYGIPDETFFLTRNGITLPLIDSVPGPKERDMKALVYTARPERGMDILLEHTFPRLLKADPNLSLYIAGYDNYVPELQPL